MGQQKLGEEMGNDPTVQMNFNARVQIRDFLTTVSLDAKIRFNSLIELGNTTSDRTTGDDVHTRVKGGGVM